MKPGIHPTWYPEAVVTCGACGNTFVTGSTKKEIHTDVCSNCHPFFTGEQRIIDTAGQVERFMKRAGQKEKIAAAHPAPDADAKPAKKEKGRDQKPALQPIVVAPAELPLAVMAEKPAAPAPMPPVVAQPAIEKWQTEPVAEIRPIVYEPALVMPAPAPLPEPSVMKPVAAKPMIAKGAKTRSAKSAKAAKKTLAKKAPAKKAAPKATSAKAVKVTKPAKAVAVRKAPAKKPVAKKPAAKKKK